MTVFRIRDCIKDAKEGKDIQLTPANSSYNHALPAMTELKKLKLNFLIASLLIACYLDYPERNVLRNLQVAWVNLAPLNKVPETKKLYYVTVIHHLPFIPVHSNGYAIL